MENKKQTAVEWLLTQININGFQPKHIEQAKAMEIDQHITSFNKGYIDGYAEIDGEEAKGFEEYFTETYEQ
jgi:hypothetical protein